MFLFLFLLAHAQDVESRCSEKEIDDTGLCPSPCVIQDDKCADSCSPGYVNVFDKCYEPTENCVGENESCTPPCVMQEGACLPQCGDAFFLNVYNRTCLLKDCTFSQPEENLCPSSCYVEDGLCVLNCSEKKKADVNKVCVSSCSVYEYNASIAHSCPSPCLIEDGKCVDVCSDGDNVNGTCYVSLDCSTQSVDEFGLCPLPCLTEFNKCVKRCSPGFTQLYSPYYCYVDNCSSIVPNEDISSNADYAKCPLPCLYEVAMKNKPASCTQTCALLYTYNPQDHTCYPPIADCTAIIPIPLLPTDDDSSLPVCPFPCLLYQTTPSPPNNTSTTYTCVAVCPEGQVSIPSVTTLTNATDNELHGGVCVVQKDCSSAVPNVEGVCEQETCIAELSQCVEKCSEGFVLDPLTASDIQKRKCVVEDCHKIKTQTKTTADAEPSLFCPSGCIPDSDADGLGYCKPVDECENLTPDPVKHTCSVEQVYYGCYAYWDNRSCIDHCPPGFTRDSEYLYCSVVNCSLIPPQNRTCPTPCVYYLDANTPFDSPYAGQCLTASDCLTLPPTSNAFHGFQPSPDLDTFGKCVPITCEDFLNFCPAHCYKLDPSFGNGTVGGAYNNKTGKPIMYGCVTNCLDVYVYGETQESGEKRFPFMNAPNFTCLNADAYASDYCADSHPDADNVCDKSPCLSLTTTVLTPTNTSFFSSFSFSSSSTTTTTTTGCVLLCPTGFEPNTAHLACVPSGCVDRLTLDICHEEGCLWIPSERKCVAECPPNLTTYWDDTANCYNQSNCTNLTPSPTCLDRTCIVQDEECRAKCRKNYHPDITHTVCVPNDNGSGSVNNTDTNENGNKNKTLLLVFIIVAAVALLIVVILVIALVIVCCSKGGGGDTSSQKNAIGAPLMVNS